MKNAICACVFGFVNGLFIGWIVVSSQYYFYAMEREKREAARDGVERIEMQRDKEVYTPPPYSPSQTVEGSCGGACNRPIDESKLRIATANETRSELAEMLDRQTEQLIRGLDTKSQLIPTIRRSDRHE